MLRIFKQVSIRRRRRAGALEPAVRAMVDWSAGDRARRPRPEPLCLLVMADPLPGREADFMTAPEYCIWATWCSFRADRSAAFPPGA